MTFCLPLQPFIRELVRFTVCPKLVCGMAECYSKAGSFHPRGSCIPLLGPHTIFNHSQLRQNLNDVNRSLLEQGLSNICVRVAICKVSQASGALGILACPHVSHLYASDTMLQAPGQDGLIYKMTGEVQRSLAVKKWMVFSRKW